MTDMCSDNCWATRCAHCRTWIDPDLWRSRLACAKASEYRRVKVCPKCGQEQEA